MFFGLPPFLPSIEVEDAFSDVQNLTSGFHLPCLAYFSDYILYNYIIEGCKFSPSIWAEPPSEAAPRITNCAPNHFINILIPSFIHLIPQSPILLKIEN